MPKVAKAKPTKEKKEKPAKKVKDKDAPKRPLSSYMFYTKKRRETIKDTHPDAKFGEVGKIMGEEWKALTDKEKKPYEKQAEADKQRYKDAMAGRGGAPAPAKGADDEEEEEEEDDD
eukprot:TRINITY_DN86_c0_g1_i1.p1 TRINITY_DN86_c0_g1~~TRINITY_DN86_c0_g1_i1.p1  ORF type:complete len:117 (-),score=41.89 TRINITY_DN86_c0_g1_i1:809-1159(-)